MEITTQKTHFEGDERERINWIHPEPFPFWSFSYSRGFQVTNMVFTMLVTGQVVGQLQ